MHSWPSYSENEIAAVAAVMRSGKVNYWTGEECRQFEKEFAELCHTHYAIAVANGTVALELALRALEIGPGDEVIVPSRTFIGTASSVLNCGARPVFADVDYETENLTIDSIQQVLSANTKAIICVHLAGWPCDMDSIMALAHHYKLKVIEDCAQAHGASYKGRPVGSFADVACFSFCQDKIISTGGEGGMLVTNHKAIWQKSWSYKDHGKSYDAVYKQSHAPGFRWLHQSSGTNWRMTEMQAAIGRLQLQKLSQWHQQRTVNAEILYRCLHKIPSIRLNQPPKNTQHAYYRFHAFVKPENLKSGWDRDRIMSAINTRGVPCFSGSCSEIYLEKIFDKDGLRPEYRLPVAMELGETTLAFLVHPTLTHGDMNTCCEVIENIMQEATNSRAVYDYEQNIGLSLDQELFNNVHHLYAKH